MVFYQKFCLSFLLLFSLVACGSGASQQSVTDNTDSIDMAERIKDNMLYKAVHFWDNFNFADTTLSPDIPQLQEIFAQWAQLSVIAYTQHDTIVTQQLISKSRHYNHAVVCFMELADNFFADPNSPLRCEELYIPMLMAAQQTDIDKIYKTRYQGILDVALMNRKGSQASNFKYLTDENVRGSLHDISSPYTLLYFFNPDCHDCGRVTSIIATNHRINSLINADSLTVLALYPDKDLSAWKKHIGENPKSWITARFATPAERDKYDLPAIPNLYLLDSTKMVILKDAPIEQIIYKISL